MYGEKIPFIDLFINFAHKTTHFNDRKTVQYLINIKSMIINMLSDQKHWRPTIDQLLFLAQQFLYLHDIPRKG